jgi:hypothetical protein
MTIAATYAQALRSLVAEDASAGKDLIANLRAALKRRGHDKLLPQIFAEYQKLELAHARIARASAATPERERTRILFELYKKLIQA